MYSGDELYGDDVTSPDAADREEARERARHDWEEDRRIERVLEAVDADNPEGDPSRNGAFG